MKKLIFTIIVLCSFGLSFGVSIGIHGVQGLQSKKILQREQEHNTTIPIIGMIFDSYGEAESKQLANIVSSLGTGRVYHLSLSPFGFTANEVANGIYDASYKKFFEDIKKLNIKVIFRTMHEMNGGRYSRSSNPEGFKLAWRRVWKIARKDEDIQSDKLLFSLSFNSQDLPTEDKLPNEASPIEYCGERRIKTKGRCPRKEDYYPGDKYVDIVGFTLYNRGRSRPDSRSKRKSPQELLTEDRLINTIEQRKKPIVIDELGTTAVTFDGNRSQEKTQKVFEQEVQYKNQRLQEWQKVIRQHSLIKAIVYFNLDATAGASKQVIGQAERSIILSKYHEDYEEGIKMLTTYNNPKTILKLFKKRDKKTKLLSSKISRDLTP